MYSCWFHYLVIGTTASDVWFYNSGRNWRKLVQTTNDSPHQTARWIAPGQWSHFDVSEGWSGNWRVPDKDGRGTLFEFNNGRNGGNSYYDISVIDRYNVPMNVVGPNERGQGQINFGCWGKPCGQGYNVATDNWATHGTTQTNGQYYVTLG
ncbi:unnamed protein product [Adineta steineri]|uniref:Uncharacterized protein n=1 Tax=Adineta steineri TaxID=433720 RepID=A0A819GR95_9BILA|nr:unnamed protein product [Adineta steineri]CAF3883819.1 unnamed protein product [Adineta steineri]